MLNKQLILNAISRYVNPQKAQSLSEAFDVANNLLNAANNPEEVFQKAGITRQSLEKARSLLNNPMSGFFINLVGGNKEELLRGLSAAEAYLDTRNLGTPNNSLIEQTPASELDKLRENLDKLRSSK